MQLPVALVTGTSSFAPKLSHLAFSGSPKAVNGSLHDLC
jgi:hypothetical protein